MATNAKSTRIVSGNYATSKNNQGNFTAKNSTGEQIFVTKEMAVAFGWKDNKDFKPCFAVVANTLMPAVTDEDGVIVQAPQMRLTASGLYATEDEAISASIADRLLAIKEEIAVRKALDTAVKDADLTDASMKAVLAGSFF